MWSQGTTENSHIGHCTRTVESANLKVQNVFHGRNNITCSTNCKYRTAATPCTLETTNVSFNVWFLLCCMMRHLIEVLVFYLLNSIFIILYYHINITIITVNDFLVWHVSTFVGHLQVIVKCNEGLSCLSYLHDDCWWCDVWNWLCYLFGDCFLRFVFCF